MNERWCRDRRALNEFTCGQSATIARRGNRSCRHSGDGMTEETAYRAQDSRDGSRRRELIGRRRGRVSPVESMRAPDKKLPSSRGLITNDDYLVTRRERTPSR